VSETRGGTQGSLQTRSFANSTERNLVYLDNIPLNALIGRGGSGTFFGGFQTFFKLVSPEEIDRVDFLTGPFSAQYDGRSEGGVLTYTSKMPDKFRLTVKQTGALMDYNWGGLQRGFPRSLTEVTLGDRWRNFSWFLTSAYQTYQFSPATWVTHDTFTGPPIYNEFLTWNRVGFPRRVVGSGGLMDIDLVNTKLKVAYDFTPTLRLSHTVGVFTEDRNMYSETLFANNGNRWFQSFGPLQGPPVPPALRQGFGTWASFYGRHQNNVLVNATSLRQNTGGVFDFDMSFSHFYVLHSVWNTPSNQLGASAANPVGGFTSTGLVRKDSGDYWGTLDLKGIYRPFGQNGAHEVSFGLYGDQAYVDAPTYLSMSWPSGQSSTFGNAYTTYARGMTRTQALWGQEVWRFHPDFKLTAGIRAEHWSASDGFNHTNTEAPSGGILSRITAPIFQPYRAHSRFSPKGVLEWTPNKDWSIFASVGMANRFPTVSELYASSTPQGLLQPVTPNPFLRPEVSLNKELTFIRNFKTGGAMRVSLFHDDVRDYIFSQLVPIPGALAPATGPANIGLVRNTGFEIDLRKSNVFLEGLDVYANATYLNSHIVSNPDFIPPGPTACAFALFASQDCWLFSTDGKRVPQLPKWRCKTGFVFSPDNRWSFSTNLRWADTVSMTVANNDVSCCSFAQGFQLPSRLFSIDAKVNYKWNDRFTFDLGIDNIGNFTTRDTNARTFYGAVRYKFEDGQKGGNGIFLAGDEAGLPNVANWFRPTSLSLD
jgi:iron complex outermembrane receptor protein